MPQPKAPDLPCGNPLFFSWVAEWMDEARQRNSKSYQTWKKVVLQGVRLIQQAYESLSQCPITYEHPSELIRLNGIGILHIQFR